LEQNSNIKDTSITIDTNSNIKKIDIEQIKEFKIYPGVYSYLVSDTLYEIIESGSYYREKIRKTGENFYHVNLYDINNYNIIAELDYFADARIGKSLFYDNDGKITKEENNDTGYKFSINDLIKKLKSEYKIDISIYNEKLSITKSIDRKDNKFKYFISLGLPNEIMRFRKITIDGKNGKTLEDKIVYAID
jgi:hypothetical protein